MAWYTQNRVLLDEERDRERDEEKIRKKKGKKGDDGAIIELWWVKWSEVVKELKLIRWIYRR